MALTVRTLVAVIEVCCDGCDRFEVSPSFVSEYGTDHKEREFVDEIAAAGWTVYRAGNRRRFYCPSCRPTIGHKMTLIQGAKPLILMFDGGDR